LHHWHPDKETFVGQAGLFIFSWDFLTETQLAKFAICIGVVGGV